MGTDEIKKTIVPSDKSGTADMDSICEEISKNIFEGLVEKEFIQEASVADREEKVIGETTLIAPMMFMDTVDKKMTDVESLIDSAEITNKIVRVVQEKVEQVLDEDLSHSRSGDSGIIAERVHLECARLFSRESFRNDMVHLLRQDIQRYILPEFRQEILQYVRRIVMDLTDLLVDKLAETISYFKGIQKRDAPAAASSTPETPLNSDETPAEKLKPSEKFMIMEAPVAALKPAPAPAAQAAAQDRTMPCPVECRPLEASPGFQRIRKDLIQRGLL